MSRKRLQIAPMLEITDRDYRYFCRLLSRETELWTEMVCVDTILHSLEDRAKLEQHLGFDPREGPVVLQLGGNDPEKLRRCAEVARRDFGYDEVNLNCGCPSDKVAGAGAFGACLMKSPGLVRECMHALAGPSSVKCRLGVDALDSDDFFAAFVDTVGCSRLVVHCRIALLKGLSPHQNRTVPPLNYPRAFKVLGERPEIEYTLNGGIQSLAEAKRLQEQAPGTCRGCMIGRAVVNNVTMLAEADTFLYGKAQNPESAYNRLGLLEKYAEYLDERYEDFGKHSSAFSAVKPLLSLFHGQPGNRKWRQHVDALSKERGKHPALVVQDIVKLWTDQDSLEKPIVTDAPSLMIE